MTPDGGEGEADLRPRPRDGEASAVLAFPVSSPPPPPPPRPSRSRASGGGGGNGGGGRGAPFYLLVDTDSEDVPVLQRLLAEHQAVVELLDRLVAPGGAVGVGQAHQLSAAGMQLRRHLQRGASLRDTQLGLRQ